MPKVPTKKKSKTGRKKLTDKKITVPLYILESKIKYLGGFESVRELLYKFLESQ